MKWETFLTMAIFALLLQGRAGAAIDHWIEENGVVTSRATFASENPATAEIVSAATRPALTPAPASEGGAAGSKSDPAAPQVELYVTSWCSYCKQAEKFFRSQGIPFTVYDIEKDSNAARRKAELDSSSGVPLAIINGQKIQGYSEAVYREALKKKP